MSEKKAKEKRREENQAQGERKFIGTMEIDMYDDFSIEARNFPKDHQQAITFLCNALLQVSAFIRQQEAGNQSGILMAKPGASHADILKMSRDN